MRCLGRALEKGATRKAAVRIAASVLTKAALDRGSKDNVTVVIVVRGLCMGGPAVQSKLAASCCFAAVLLFPWLRAWRWLLRGTCCVALLLLRALLQ